MNEDIYLRERGVDGEPTKEQRRVGLLIVVALMMAGFIVALLAALFLY